MKMFTILSILCILSFTLPAASSAQTKEWILTSANDWTIITSARDTLRSCIIDRLEGDVVNLICGGSAIQIPVDSLNLLTRHKESHFWSGAGYGALIGTAVGVIVGLASYEKPKSTGFFTLDFGSEGAALAGGILGTVAGFTIGGVIGAVSGGDERYDLSQKPAGEKIKILRDLGAEGSGWKKIPIEKSAGKTDILYLNDGSVIRGTIVGEVGAEGYLERVTIRTVDGQTRSYEASIISRIERGQ
jgi:hypothetical protein